MHKEEIDSVSIPTTEGEITILSNHIPLVAILKPGVLTVRKGGEEMFMAVSGGFVEVQPPFASTPAKATVDEKATEGKPVSRVIILADTAERAEELTLEAVEAARERAQKLLEEKRGADEVAYGAVAAALERELARLKVARRHRSRNEKLKM